MKTKHTITSLILCTLLNTAPCHAWRLPVPTKRDISVAIMASISTFAFLRNYYFGQEERIKAAISTHNTETQNTVKAEARETRETIKETNSILLTAVDQASSEQQEQHRGLATMLLKIYQDQQSIKHNVETLTSFCLEKNSTQPLLLENKPKGVSFHIHLGSDETPCFKAALARVKLPQNAHLITTIKKVQSIPVTTAVPKNLFVGVVEHQESFFSRIKGTIGL